MIKFVNLTPQKVNIYGKDEKLILSVEPEKDEKKMDYTRKEQMQTILESIVPSDWIQDTEEGLENVEKEK